MVSEETIVARLAHDEVVRLPLDLLASWLDFLGRVCVTRLLGLAAFRAAPLT